MRKRLLGFAAFCIGVGMVMAVVVPTLGWIFLTAAIFLLIGYLLVCS